MQQVGGEVVVSLREGGGWEVREGVWRAVVGAQLPLGVQGRENDGWVRARMARVRRVGAR